MFGSFSGIVVCPGRNSSFALSAQIVHCNSPRDMRRKKSGDALPLWSACCQRQFQNPPGPLPRCPCLQEGWCRSSVRLRHTDSIKMIGERHPEVAATILRASNSCTRHLEEAGFVAPDWVQLASGEVQAPDVVDKEEPNQPRKGWQAAVSRVVETEFWDGLLPTLSNSDATLLRSQAGPLASIPFTVFPTDRSCRIDPQPFCILLLRRLRLPLPFTARSCVCGRLLGPPSSLGLLSCWDPWTKGISSGDCCGPHLRRSRWKGADQRVLAGARPGCRRCSRQQAVGSRR